MLEMNRVSFRVFDHVFLRDEHQWLCRFLSVIHRIQEVVSCRSGSLYRSMALELKMAARARSLGMRASANSRQVS